jgi:hypothetical protein
MKSHVSDDVREEFCLAAENAQPKTYPFTAALLTKLQDCTDTVPAGVCDVLGIPAGSAYSVAVQEIRRKLGVVLSSLPIEHRGSKLKNAPVKDTDLRRKV